MQSIITLSIMVAMSTSTLIISYKSKNKKYIKNIRNISMLGSFFGGIVGILLNHSFAVCGVISDMLAGTLFFQLLMTLYTVIKEICQEEARLFYDDGILPKFYITGDKHRDFSRVKKFCSVRKTRRKDILIILGDTGFNYYNDKRDDELKKEISQLNITLFCLHGNKENRPQNIGTYGIRSFCGGKVFYEPQYPNIYFAIDGEIYTFEGKKYMVIGGAHSVDKIRCLEEGMPFWYDEMPDDTIKATVEANLLAEGNKIYGIMAHTCPIDYLPTEMFMSTRQNATINGKSRKAKSKKLFKPDIDRSTEIWLGELEKNIDFEVWFCGHYHIDKQINKIHMMFNDIRPLHNEMEK